MKRRDFLKTTGAIGTAAVITPWGVIQHRQVSENVNAIDSEFLSPPQSAKPHTWWHWMNGNVTKEGITLDLEAMARVGIGGFQNFDAGTGIPKGPVVYLSPAWLELKKHAITEAQRLGLEFTMHNCPGWSSSGGPWITPDLAMQQVVFTEATYVDKPINLERPEAKLDFYKEICVIAFPKQDNKVKDWEQRSNLQFNRYGVDDIPEGTTAIDEKDIIDVTRYMQRNGYISWTPPKKGEWTIIRFGHTPIGTQNRSAPDTGVGLECDKYSASAFEFHFNKMMENLLPYLEPLGKSGKVGLLIDSYEVGMQNWTPGFEELFKTKNHYSIINYMPALTGRVVGSADTTNRFLWDLRRTQGDLMADNYYGKFTELCHKHKIISYIQPYDRGPMEEMQIGSRIDINVGEFWNNLSAIFQNNLTMRRTVKLSAAIAHTNGQNIVAAESFTAEPGSGKWQEHPFNLKALGDRMFTQGLNRMIFHRFAHQPHPTAKPGMTMGPWGTHFDRTNTWWEQGAEWIKYLSRCQHMLQQGTFVADLVYFTGEDAGVYTRVEPHELMPPPPEGLDYDLINSEVLLKSKVVDNRLVTENGPSYHVLSIQDFKTMSLKILSRIIEFQRQGLTVIGQKPLRTPGLSNDQKDFEHLVGDLKLSSDSLDRLLKDFTFTSRSGDAPVRWIHRKTADTDIYFIANERRSVEDLVCNFRVANKEPELWDPVSGKIVKPVNYDLTKDYVTVPITLQPAGSLFIVFRKRAEFRTATSIKPYSTERSLPTEQNTFTMPALMAKPETSIMLTTNNFMDGQLPWTDWYCVYPSPGEKLFGQGHSTIGLAVGRNGVAVWENANGRPEFMFSVERSISGWTEILLKCDDGVPSIYINKQLAKSGNKSRYVIHPAPGQAYLSEGASFFNGDMYWLPADTSPGSKVSKVSVLNDWTVSFPKGSGAPESVKLNKLRSLHEHEDDRVKYFSGTCTYATTFKGLKKKKGRRYFIDLGSVEVIAEVKLNGKSLGTYWTRPFEIDVTDTLVEDTNRLEVHVTTLWINRLIGDEQKAEVDKYAKAEGNNSSFSALMRGAIEDLPDWYKNGEPKPDNGRVAFTTWKHYDKDSPLVQAGLIGPVNIFTR